MSSARAAVLDAVRDLGRLCSVREIAERFDLHPNTVREHLDALLDQGLVVREAAPPQGRGRPALMYRATTANQDALRDYELLTAVLAEQISGMPDGVEVALAAGRAWGRRHVDGPGRRLGLEELPTEMGRLGFEPTPPSPDGTVVLRACPILDAARRHPDVVCTVHLGFAQALVESCGADPSDVHLEPMGSPMGCPLRIGDLAAE